MDKPYDSAGFTPEAMASAAQRFFELLQTFGPGAAAARPQDWSSLAGPLAGQFEQWLKFSQSTGPWFGGLGGAGAAGQAFAPSPGWTFGPLPLGPGAVPQGEAQRSFELLGRLAQLQGQLAAHWSEVANNAARSFIARLGSPPGGFTPESALKLYELWVDCAEEAYGATVRKEEFCRLQGELANVSAALLIEQRRHAESLVRAFGLPTRNEMDALYGQLKELRAQLAQLAQSTRATAPGTARAKSGAHAKGPAPRRRRARAGRPGA